MFVDHSDFAILFPQPAANSICCEIKYFLEIKPRIIVVCPITLYIEVPKILQDRDSSFVQLTPRQLYQPL
jgi:hypothetical protein